MIGARITLSPQQQDMARWAGAARNAANVAKHVKNRRIDPDGDDVWLNVRGVGAEMAHADCFGVTICLVGERWGGTVDCWHDGIPVDVKETDCQNGRCLCPLHQAGTLAAYFALWISDWPTFTFRGFCRKCDLVRNDRIIDVGHGPTYGLPQDKLTIHTLADIASVARVRDLLTRL